MLLFYNMDNNPELYTEKISESHQARQDRLLNARVALERKLLESDIELRPGGMDQHFMIDSKVLDDLTESVTKEDVVFEIGAGIGILTECICDKRS